MTVKQQMQPLPLADVKIADAFWSPRLEVNRAVTIPHQYKQCKATGRIDAFRLKWKQGDPNPPHIFWDSDVSKWIEAAAYTLAAHPDRALEKLLDETIDLIVSAQQPDGYLNTHYTVVEPGRRWTNLKDCHELYCAGTLMESAVAYVQATGKRKFLDTVCRYTDYIATIFGTKPGQKRGYCGHEEIELALVKLFKATGRDKYLKLAKYFVDERGRRHPHYFDVEAPGRTPYPNMPPDNNYTYFQAHKPLRKQDEVVGHAVRSMYICAGMADVAALTDDAALLRACRKLWDSATLHKMYVTGGVGSNTTGEAFTGNYDLPNQSAYAETCAAIGLVFFAQRMLQLEADARYADVLERSLYNGSLAGVSLDGKKFFYVNPLASSGNHHRSEWFGCACCPPNIARLLASLGQYIYSASDSALYAHLYVGSNAKVRMGGSTVILTQKTNYPWDGAIDFVIRPARPMTFDLMLRIPGWCRKYKLTVNGKACRAPLVKGYARLRRTWAAGDCVQLVLDMPVERLAAHPAVAEACGKVALQRGPLLYCLEQTDNTAPVGSILLGEKAWLTARFNRKLMGGVTVIEGEGLTPDAGPWKKALYQEAPKPRYKRVKFRAVPYALWDNRRGGAMLVWLPRA